MTLDLSVSWLGMQMASPCSTLPASIAAPRRNWSSCAFAAGAVVTKSCTLAPRAGNPEPRYRRTALGSINSMGLPNEGYRYYLTMPRLTTTPSRCSCPFPA